MIFRKGIKVTPMDSKMEIDREYVMKVVREQQSTWMHRLNRTAMPEGEIIYCEQRDPTKPTPAHVGHWQRGGILLDMKEKQQI
jgi:hypothetical protein